MNKKGMPVLDLTDHPQRFHLANELHARPFPEITAPGFAVYLAIKAENNAAARNRDADRAFLIALLDRFGAPHPQPGATHYFGDIGKYRLKWENHTEFTTFTVFGQGLGKRAFDPAEFEVFPKDWLATAPGVRLTSVLIRVQHLQAGETAHALSNDWFVPESLAISRVLDGAATIAGDFRIDSNGHIRFAILPDPKTGSQRSGRILQRLCEIETYKSMSMLGLTRAREISAQLGPIDAKMTHLVESMKSEVTDPESSLQELLGVSADLESMAAQSSFRFGATVAYEKIVNQRIEVLREERVEGQQTFAEFMMRRFDPAMRTVKSTERQLNVMAERAIRASDLLRTRVDVERSAQNQLLLASMDKRADQQLRLQRTVEGLSVVAISYYAVNLVGYVAYPLIEPAGLSKGMATAMITPLVVLGVWWLVRRIRRKVER